MKIFEFATPQATNPDRRSWTSCSSPKTPSLHVETVKKKKKGSYRELSVKHCFRWMGGNFTRSRDARMPAYNKYNNM